MNEEINFSQQSELSWKGGANNLMVWLQYGNFHNTPTTLQDIVLTFQRYLDTNSVQLVVNSVPRIIEETVFAKGCFEIGEGDDTVGADGIGNLQIIPDQQYPAFSMGNIDYDDNSQMLAFRKVLEAYDVSRHSTFTIAVDNINMVFPLSEATNKAISAIFSSKEDIQKYIDLICNIS